jgi:hypothetical protein
MNPGLKAPKFVLVFRGINPIPCLLRNDYLQL